MQVLALQMQRACEGQSITRLWDRAGGIAAERSATELNIGNNGRRFLRYYMAYLSQRDHTRDHLSDSLRRSPLARHSREKRELMRKLAVTLKPGSRRTIEGRQFGEAPSGND